MISHSINPHADCVSRNLVRENVMSSLAKATLVFLLAVAALLTSFAQPTFSQVLPGSAAGTPPSTSTPVDPLNRTTPSGSVLGFLQAAQSGDYSIAAQYLQMSPARRQIDGERIATELKAVMDSPKAFSGKVGGFNQAEGTLQESVPLGR